MVTPLKTFNVNALSFEEPVCSELRGFDRHYYTQNLKYQGRELRLQTDWFHGSGFNKQNLFNRPNGLKELLVTLTPEMRSVLKLIEERAIFHGLQLPSEYQNNSNNAEIFKILPDRDNLFFKLTYEATCFDHLQQPIKDMDSLSVGDYRAILLVKGLYIGYHSMGKFASLQIRVDQIQYTPRPTPFYFQSSSLPTAMSMIPSSNAILPISASNKGIPSTPQPMAEPTVVATTAAAAKRGRKPVKLQRQNAISEARIQQEEQQRQLNVLPADFFSDTLAELLNTI